MHPGDCPNWEYKDHPSANRYLPLRCNSVLVNLRYGRPSPRALVRDTRNCHSELFEGLTPPRCGYYAGHYRGELFRCLQFHKVGIKADPRVGAPPGNVAAALQVLTDALYQGFPALDTATALPDAQLPPHDKVYYVVTFACRVFAEFLRIHPYVNGNGHMGRLIIWAILGAYGLWPKRWPLNDRPPDPPYSSLIEQHRDGNCEPLEKFVLQCVNGTI